MINRTIRERIDTLLDTYRDLATRHPEALYQVALAELAETA